MVRELLHNKTAKEKANIKAKEIAKIKSIPKTARKDYDIEIVDIVAIEGGVEVFARVWKGGKQIGFGRDGSVDVERFRIFNPPILVADENGDVIHDWTDEVTGEYKVTKYREDIKEALIQVIEHNLSVMKNVHENGRIVGGKVGNTTSTFYPSADDTVYQNPGTAQTWATIRGATAGDGLRKPSTGFFPAFIRTPSSSGWNTMERGFYIFDTSSIPDTDAIDSATLSLYGNGNIFDSLAGATKEVAIVGTTPASNTAIVVGDYDQVADTKLATNIAFGSWNISAYNNFTLNATGLSAISKTGYTKLGSKHENDRANVEPTKPGSDALSGVNAKSSTTTGTTEDPKLVVEHSVGSTAYTLTAEVGSFTLTGISAGLKRAYALVADTGSFVLTGFDAIIIGGKRLVAETGEFILTGSDALFHVTLSMLAGTGSFTLTGFATGFSWGRTMVADTGSFILSGVDVVLRKGVSMVAETGEFVLTGVNAGLSKGYNMVASTGTFILTGFAVKFPILWHNITKNVENWVNRTKNVESWVNADKTNNIE